MLRSVMAATLSFLSFVIATAAEPSREPDQAIAGLDVHSGLNVELFAAEPMLLSPSNIDVDHRGRVWVCEIVNYRAFRNKHTMRPEGDRILILEDTTGDGIADSRKVFYQGTDIDSAHGICVLGNRVIVSANDKVQVLIDDDGDDKVDRKETLFSGISGTQHDHGIHAFIFGPDGRLYFNFGNNGKQLKDRYGSAIVDRAGNTVDSSRKPYQEGMAFRCNLDGSVVETLGWNFRNNWELAVDSFGTIWQSDNDDDGNRGTRINFVMEFGNYGYRDEITGDTWRTVRTGMHEEIPLRHWHLRDPGVVPNLLQTGAGSPTGICIYEGELLPTEFRNQMLHCDAGPNIVRAYPVKPDGAGYSAEIVDILKGERDQWFRPSDVCIAPDGSLIVADWYDPGVGGHRMGDPNRGRLFRVAPPGVKYSVQKFDFETADGAVAALRSPNHEARFLAWTALQEMGLKAEAALKSLTTSDNPRYRARALWLLAAIYKDAMPDENTAAKLARQAVADEDAAIRIVGLRIARQYDLANLPALVKQLVRDENAHVRRECCVALRHLKHSSKPELWADLAEQYAGDDRWYLEALGIAATDDWDACIDAWLKRVGDKWKTPAGLDIVWRSRAKQTPELLGQILSAAANDESAQRYLRAFDFLAGSPSKESALTQLAFGPSSDTTSTYVIAEAINRVQSIDFQQNPEYRTALNRVLSRAEGTQGFVSLVERFSLEDRYKDLIALAEAKPGEQVGIEAARVLLTKQQRPLIRRALSGDPAKATALATAMANSADASGARFLYPYITDDSQPVGVRREAIRAASVVRDTGMKLIETAQAGEIDDTLKPAAAAAMHAAPFGDVRAAAKKLFPLPAGKNDAPLPSIRELSNMKGNAKNGRLLFHSTATCAKCHVVNGIGREIGPNLSEIGNKLSRDAMFQSIIYPSAGISHNYESYSVVTVQGTVANGLLVGQTDGAVTIKNAEGISRTIARDDIDEMVKQDVSLMPADLQKILSAQDLVDIVLYMQTLKKARKQ